MQILSPGDWPRQPQFDHFQQVALPYVGVTADVEVQALQAYCARHDLSFYRATLYALARVVDDLIWLRYRIRDSKVVCHPQVNTAITALGPDQQVRFTTVPWQASWQEFDAACAAKSQEAEVSLSLYNGNPDGDLGDDLVYYSCMPWLRFTQMIQPMPLGPACSIPRIMWGKYVREGDKLVMPMSIQVHHGLADGLHLGQFFQCLQTKLDHPATWLK